ncbi:MAG: hypothetical protein HCA25_18385 [Dolichospermum sp. DET50]|nr:hypothetical protein [Dolichospermum sp. DET66]MBS3034181.1 hypothetical protein [Dolichospermum sp. DET67]MBS3039384.1 hypothetical protein [Dolichospermum sp. DET50]QSX66607.1 MAG: hypothetical protein EZY12_17650 [Dolichospermum sp. DET69]
MLTSPPYQYIEGGELRKIVKVFDASSKLDVQALNHQPLFPATTKDKRWLQK